MYEVLTTHIYILSALFPFDLIRIIIIQLHKLAKLHHVCVKQFFCVCGGYLKYLRACNCSQKLNQIICILICIVCCSAYLDFRAYKKV